MNKILKSSTSIWSNLNHFHSLEIVNRVRDTTSWEWKLKNLAIRRLTPLLPQPENNCFQSDINVLAQPLKVLKAWQVLLSIAHAAKCMHFHQFAYQIWNSFTIFIHHKDAVRWDQSLNNKSQLSDYWEGNERWIIDFWTYDQMIRILCMIRKWTYDTNSA